jgi:hypothetical protein
MPRYIILVELIFDKLIRYEVHWLLSNMSAGLFANWDWEIDITVLGVYVHGFRKLVGRMVLHYDSRGWIFGKVDDVTKYRGI